MLRQWNNCWTQSNDYAQSSEEGSFEDLWLSHLGGTLANTFYSNLQYLWFLISVFFWKKSGEAKFLALGSISK